MLYLIAVLLPPLAMLLCGKPIMALISLVLQITVLGWLPATIWALFVVNSHSLSSQYREVFDRKPTTGATKVSAPVTSVPQAAVGTVTKAEREAIILAGPYYRHVTRHVTHRSDGNPWLRIGAIVLALFVLLTVIGEAARSLEVLLLLLVLAAAVAVTAIRNSFGLRDELWAPLARGAHRALFPTQPRHSHTDASPLARLEQALQWVPRPKSIGVEGYTAWIDAPTPDDPGSATAAPRSAAMRTAREPFGTGAPLVAETARWLVAMAFASSPAVREAVVSLFRSMVDPLTGRDVRACVLSVRVDRKIFEGIVHGRVTPENFLRNFPHRTSYDGSRQLAHVQPFLRESMDTPSANQLESASGAELNTMDPLQFEALIRHLLERMGFQASLTKASHDGGIDIEAVNPQPVVGGKLLVQCKRYDQVVGAAAVRDLYGAVTDARATKGILVTTSHFSPDARRFAEGKPIELIDRPQLEALLAEHRVVIPRAPGAPH
jgi:uncharacterized membrane protein YqaE (UPF0057 family)